MAACRAGGHVDAYVRRIVANAAIDTDEPVTGQQPMVANSEPAPEVITALLKLPGMQRRVVVLRHLLDLSVAQVADETTHLPRVGQEPQRPRLTKLNQLLTEQHLQETQRWTKDAEGGHLGLHG